MRKRTVIFLLAFLLLSLVGCNGNQTAQQTVSQPDSAGSSETDSSSHPTGAENSGESSLTPSDGSTSSDKTPEAGETASVPASLPATQPTSSEIPNSRKDHTDTPAQKESSAPSSSAQIQAPPEKPAEPEPVEKNPEPTQPSEPEPPAFDIDHWVAYAKEYGVQIELTLDSTAKSCVDTYITAGPQSKYLERDISGLLDWFKEQGFTGFWPWYEEQADGTYWLYIGYV